MIIFPLRFLDLITSSESLFSGIVTHLNPEDYHIGDELLYPLRYK